MIAASLPALLLLVTMTAIARPTLEEVRKDMGTPSTGEVRGQRDTVGYAVTPQAMARVWELSTSGPAPESFGAKVAPGVLGVIGPHDDYVYTARVYREIFPLVTARTVVIVGVFHRYRKFEGATSSSSTPIAPGARPTGRSPYRPCVMSWSRPCRKEWR